MSKLFLQFIAFCCIAFSTYSQTKSISSVKTNQSPRIDANPDDAVWRDISYVSGFTTSTPVYGKPADETHVKICYNNSAVYVLAYMHDDPKNIRKQLTRRDEVTGNDVDFFSVGIDTYHDKQNAFLFKVSAAGVQE